MVLGNIQPKFTYGFNTKVAYKNWDLFVSLSGSCGNKLFNALACRLDRGNGYYYNPLGEVANRWTVTNPSNTIQKASSATSIYADDRFVENASYLKFRNIQLGYTLPVPQITKDAKLRLYVSLQNFFTITSYSGYDPEANRNGIDETSALYQEWTMVPTLLPKRCCLDLTSPCNATSNIAISNIGTSKHRKL